MPPVLAFAVVRFSCPAANPWWSDRCISAKRPPEVRSARHILLQVSEARRCLGRSGSHSGARRWRTLARSWNALGPARTSRSWPPSTRRTRTPRPVPCWVRSLPACCRRPSTHFLFSAGLGDVSAPLVDDRGIHILQRIESHAAVRQILLRGSAEEVRARCADIAAKLREGADFADLARTCSDDPESAERGGQFAIYERGPTDALLKSATFALRVGEVSEPIESRSDGMSSSGFRSRRRIRVSRSPPSSVCAGSSCASTRLRREVGIEFELWSSPTDCTSD